MECITCSLETAMSIVFENVEKVTMISDADKDALSFYKIDSSIPLARYNTYTKRLTINL